MQPTSISCKLFLNNKSILSFRMATFGDGIQMVYYMTQRGMQLQPNKAL